MSLSIERFFMPISLKHLGYFVVLLSNIGFLRLAPAGWVADGVHGELISPLMRSAKEGNVQRVKAALEAHENIDAQSKSGMTALHYAIHFGQEEAAAALIENGAAIHILDMQHNTPLSMARGTNQHSTIALLEKMILATTSSGKMLFNEDKHFILLVASFNNAQWYKKNLQSIFAQTYEKYTVIYMDDLSSDGTFDRVKAYIRDKGFPKNFILVKNTSKKYCLGNYVWAIDRFCPDNAILITLDGDDWFPNAGVLAYLNDVYKNPGIWLTYGESITYPQNVKTSHCKRIAAHLLTKEGALRQECIKRVFWPVHHLRSFYVWLFRKILVGDLLDDQGNLYTFAEDVAYMLPMLEMCGTVHHKYLSKILYVYNRKNPLITTKIIGNAAIQDRFIGICQKKPYKKIALLNDKKAVKPNKGR